MKWLATLRLHALLGSTLGLTDFESTACDMLITIRGFSVKIREILRVRGLQSVEINGKQKLWKMQKDKMGKMEAIGSRYAWPYLLQ